MGKKVFHHQKQSSKVVAQVASKVVSYATFKFDTFIVNISVVCCHQSHQCHLHTPPPRWTCHSLSPSRSPSFLASHHRQGCRVLLIIPKHLRFASGLSKRPFKTFTIPYFSNPPFFLPDPNFSDPTHNPNMRILTTFPISFPFSGNFF